MLTRVNLPQDWRPVPLCYCRCSYKVTMSFRVLGT